jgi:hypothetical protein
MADKLQVSDQGEVYVDGALRLVGSPAKVVGNGDMLAHLLRLESTDLSPLDKLVHVKVMNAFGFHRNQDGVWREPS